MVRPRHAASLVITRGSGSDTRVLMGRRPSNDRFMPDVHVFPGGRVDRGDQDARVTADLTAGVETRLACSARGVSPRAIAIAAVRETWEETGLRFGAVRDGGLCPDLSPLDYVGRAITPANNPIRYHARFLHAPAEKAQGTIRSNGELLDLQWYSFSEARDLTIIDVTEAILTQLENRLAGRSQSDLFVHYRRASRILTPE